ncbi:DNA-binding SARP family transcriptional activator [Actinomadura pelletieri DSM 43383]|uniref:DNA-binding SARP family transcriptional activator n=1 Tax=Actinomadura pelletieri DSM 43383 TaxID=1120940 RepID=A0A495QZR2_9ACTN|nr:tetratricopeptide repeat protein [Actinomadura pelletieri]RKS79703.1 DNA-binding SARP family transcriptional activator [Actinomadura pelletieri DSM 43383]
MEFRILGQMEVWSGGQRQHLGWAKERCLLAALLMTPGRPVTIDVLIDRVWDGDAPPKARDLLYPHMTRLRRTLHALGEARLEQRSGAYVLDVDPDAIDYHRFLSLRDQARAIADSGRRDEAVRLLGEALRLWRAEPLGGVAGRWAARRRHGMQEEFLGASLELARLRLDRGDHALLIPELNELVDRFPDAEKPVELLMLALHRSGRSGEALRVFEHARQRMAVELGAVPHAELRELHRRILTGDPALMPPRQSTRVASPSDLPRDLHTFTGRETELARLTALAEDGGTAVTVLAIDGMPGVGKSTLAIHLAHALAPRYPDGQSFIDLCAYDPEREPLDPASALDRLLRAIGVVPERIPQDLDGRAALWRSELAGRRVLLILDNALGHDQVRPLLPGTPGCLVLVTSRRRLAGLDAARTLQLDVLDPVDAADLLIKSAELGPDADPAAVRTVVRLCGHLPLAVQLIGNRLRHRTSWTVSDLVERLGAGGRLLSEIRAENRRLHVAFELSYLDLDADGRRAFRLLGLHPGLELSALDAAILLDTEPAEAEALLDGLHDRHLIGETRPARYRFHDLIREYARRLVAEHDPPSIRDAALDRLLDHYLVAASHADRLLFPYRARPVPTVSEAFFKDEEQARSWMRTELDNVLRVARVAFEIGRPRHAALLAKALGEYLEKQGHWPEAVAIHEQAVQAWTTLDDTTGTTYALVDLSRLLLRAGELEEALEVANRGRNVVRDTAAPGAVATVLDQLGLIHWHRSDYDVALGYYEQALELRRSIGDRQGEAEVLSHLSIVIWHQGRYTEANDALQRALSLHEAVGNRAGQQMALNNLGLFELRLGHNASALRYFEKAGEVMEMGRQHRAVWLNNVATVRVKAGQTAEVIDLYREALTIYQEIGDRRCEAACLNNIGRWYAETGREREALIHFQNSLSVSREIAERFEATAALLNIAETYHGSGRHRLALEHYEEALDAARSIGDAYQEARALDGLGQVTAQIRGIVQATPYDRQALELYENLGVPEAEAVRARLAERDDAAES